MIEFYLSVMPKKYDITALIYDRKGNVLSIGKNSYVKTHPMQAMHAKACGLEDKVFMHAEINAIARCRDIDKAHRIEVVRFDSTGKPRIAKPCKICARAISFTNIKEVVHT